MEDKRKNTIFASRIITQNKTTMKKILFTLVTLLLPMLAWADYSGECGSGLTYTLEEATGVLTISKTGDGTGEMRNWNYYDDVPWYKVRDNIRTVIMEEGVTSIGNWAISECSGLTSVTIPNSVTSIGNGAFFGCTGLTSVTIPNSVTSIGSSAFSGCSGLTSIIVESGNPKYDSRDNCNAIIETSSNTLIVGCKSTVIPSSVTSIGDYAFSGCSGLTSVNIPSSVTSIGVLAFSGCSSLTSMTIPNGVTSIGEAAFYECSGLTSVTIPDGVTSIGDYAFGDCSGLISVTIGCSGLTSVTIPNGVTSVGEYAFSGCSGLTSVTIPNSVTSIGSSAFSGCSGLTSVTIPNSVTYIGWGAFQCNELRSVKSYITEPYSINKAVFPDDTYRKGTLYIPEGTEKLYARFDGWREFLNIVEMGDNPDIPGAEKCATPTISFVNGKIYFSCETEGVEYKYTIEAADAKEGYGNGIKITNTYKVSVYAFKDGWNNSETAIAEITAAEGDLNGDGVINAADVVKLTDIIIEQ